MNTQDALNKEFLSQDFPQEQLYAETLDRYKQAACNYAQMESAIAVLSDWRTNTSYIYYGRFSQTLDLDLKGDSTIHSIWEEEIFRFIHPDDLTERNLQELRFFYFIKRLPPNKYTDYYLAGKLRMKSKTGSYVPILHRIFYIPSPSRKSLWLALCLYTPLVIDTPVKYMIIDSVTGNITELTKQNDAKILSAREKQIVRLIDKGLMSKEIAQVLSISINTVSRHRQEILSKLQVKNSIEACRIAKELELI